ncbi:hypothetical protein [Desertibacillus haloalkaliphilus]|uniref:hypothetical protein n=1 Tax=Desertibacillus haloalkaliphilus TaxID=1328930 RepID=UPI001C26CC72|nr:hypothetical protein [Desertibacillus haloalkaliphilus]MBU8908838.1 hypothetical protein [Desertibacillus haloalkaliphilus]
MELTKETQATTTKKLFITCLDHDIKPFILDELNIRSTEMIVLKSYDNVISHPFDSIIRNIIISIYENNVDEIYIIGEQEAKRRTLDRELIMRKMNDDGITKNAIKTLEYLKDPIGEDMYQWLVGDENCIESAIKKSKATISNHPLIPNRISVRGLLVNNEKETVTYLEDQFANQ